MTLKQQAAKGVAWSAIEGWGSQAISFVVFLILARLLEPQAFGLVALAGAFILFAEIFLEQGMGDAVVQRADLAREHLDTAFWTNLLMGSLLTALGVFGSPFIATFFREPRLGPVLAWLSLGFLFTGLSSTQRALLQRGMDFKSLAARSLLAVSIGGLVGIGMALAGYGVWALVAKNLVGGAAGVIVLWRVSEWRPHLTISWHHFKELFSFSSYIAGSRLMDFFNRNSDDLLIGYFLGATALGYYTVAYRILRIVTSSFVGIVSTVALPMFSRLQKQPEQLRSNLYLVTRLTSAVAFPVFVGLALLAPELVTLLYGARWSPSIPVMQVLALIGILHAVLYFNSVLIVAVGKPAWRFGITSLNALGNVIAFALVVRWGIVAVAAAYVIRGYLLSPVPLWVLRQLIQVDVRTYLRQFAAPFFASLCMTGAVLLAKAMLGEGWAAPVRLVVYTLVGALTYLAVMQILARSVFVQLLEFGRLALPWGSALSAPDRLESHTTH